MREQLIPQARHRAKRRNTVFSNAIQTLEQRLLFTSFIAGDLAVERIGTGSGALLTANLTNPTFIDEFNPTGGSQSALLTVALPTAAGTGSTPNPLTATSSFGEGLMNLSADGHYLIVPGYAAVPNSDIVTQITGGGTPNDLTRAVGRISNSGSIDTTTTANNVGNGNFRGAISSDGSGFWAATSNSGVVFLPYGHSGASGVQISNTSTTSNTRSLSIFNGQLYVGASTSSGPLVGPGTVGVGSGLPTTGLVTIAELSGFFTSTSGNSPFQFVFKDANTIYVADAGTTGVAGIQKWTLSGSTWSMQYSTLAAASGNADAGLVGLAIDANGVLYGTTTNTTANRLVRITDTGSTFTFTTLATAPTNESFRGVSLTPEAPTVGSVSATPSSIFTNGTTTLAAQGVVEVDGTAPISSVSFYREAVTGTQNPGADTLVPGTATQSGNTWTLSNVATTGLAANSYTYYAVATDANGVTSPVGSAATAVLTINNAAAPTIASFSATPSTDNVGASTALTANNVTAASGDSVASVKFYLETGTTPGFSGDDTLLGAGTASGNNYTLNFTPSSIGLGGGTYTVYAVATATSGAVSTASPTSLVVVVPQVAFDVSSVTVDESVGNVVVTVDRTGDTADAITVPYTTVNGTAVAGTNFGTQGDPTQVTGSVPFAANATTATISIPIIEFKPQGGDKTFTISLGSATPSNLGTVISPTPETITIHDTAVIFNLSSPTYSVNESVNGDGVGTAIFSVIRSGRTTDSAAVVYSTVDLSPSAGSAKPGTNYSTTSGTISFAAGQTVGTFSVPILAASPQGGNLTFGVALSSPTADDDSAGTLGSVATATATIIDSAPLTNNLTSSTATFTDIETSGAFADSFFPVLGSPAQSSGSFSFISYEIMEFSKTNSPSLYPAAGSTIASLQNMSLQLFNTTNSGTFNGHPGNFNVYFIPNSDATTPTSSFKFLTSDVNGLNGQGGTGPNTLIGTFSFNDAVGYDTYTPASIPSAVSTALISALNSGSNFRLAVTPQTTDMVADWSGTDTPGHHPTLSFTATKTQQSNSDEFDFSTAGYTVNENAGTATITVNRIYTASDSSTSDAASVMYSTSDGTALAGTNYTATSGTLSFAAGQLSKTFTIPITNLNPQKGNKLLNLSLSSPASLGSNTTAFVGITSTATLTIVDTHAVGTPTTILGWSTSNTYVNSGGPNISTSATKFLDILGSSNGSTAAYGVLDFNVQDGSGYQFQLPSQTSVTAINSITLGLVNSLFSGSANGILDVYLVSNTTTSLTDTNSGTELKYDTTAVPEGLSTQLGTKLLVGQINYHTTDSTSVYTQYTLTNFSQAALDAIKTALNSNQPFRFALTDESPSTSGTFLGYGFGTTANFPNDPNGAGFDGPQLAMNVDEAPTSNLPGWLDPTSQVTWTSPTLEDTGIATITGDPASATPADSPTVNVDTASSQLAITPTTAGSTINIPTMALSNGGLVTVTASASPLTPTVLSVPSLTFGTGGGKLDLKNNELLTNLSPTAVESLLHSGSIFTSSAGSLGYKVSGGQTEVRFTLDGDANLDGHVNMLDFNALAGDFGSTSKLWGDGDFDYNTTVNSLDLNAIATNFGKDVGGTYSAPLPEGALLSASPFSTAPVSAAAPAASTVTASYSPASDLFGSTKTLAADVLS
jgi:Calx-beta domain